VRSVSKRKAVILAVAVLTAYFTIEGTKSQQLILPRVLAAEAPLNTAASKFVKPKLEKIF
jgi:hypothetical protein